ncbi:MAG TPA: kelch repeat-containing protein, partial [Polyangiaceae bacterium LLY-WYZ-14_1]|nr:kelch repeat-containing protein [Polyangiaceae bacterium LLY-WYZ-14_1]
MSEEPWTRFEGFMPRSSVTEPHVRMNQIGCAGTLVGRRLVVTAAHCLNFVDGHPTKGVSLRMRDGTSVDVRGLRDEESCIVHPEFNEADLEPPWSTCGDVPTVPRLNPSLFVESADLALMVLSEDAPSPGRRMGLPETCFESSFDAAGIAYIVPEDVSFGLEAEPSIYFLQQDWFGDYDRPSEFFESGRDSGTGLIRMNDLGPIFGPLVGVISTSSRGPGPSFLYSDPWLRTAILDDIGDRFPDAVPDYLKADRDGDDLPDVLDFCPDVPSDTPGEQHDDSDRDFVGDDCEEFPYVRSYPCPGCAGSCNFEGDRDGDRVPAAFDRCPDVHDRLFDWRDDVDGDDVPDFCDNCVEQPNPRSSSSPFAQPDGDGDGIGDACDNCPELPNPAQANCNVDAELAFGLPERGDACDPNPCAETVVSARRVPMVPGFPGEGIPLNGDIMVCRNDIRMDARRTPSSSLPMDLRIGVRHCQCEEARQDTRELRRRCQSAIVVPGALGETGSCGFSDSGDAEAWNPTVLTNIYDTLPESATVWNDVSAAFETTPLVSVEGTGLRAEARLAFDGLPRVPSPRPERVCLGAPFDCRVGPGTDVVSFDDFFGFVDRASAPVEEAFRLDLRAQWSSAADQARLGTSGPYRGILWSHVPGPEAASLASPSERRGTNHFWAGEVPRSCLEPADVVLELFRGFFDPGLVSGRFSMLDAFPAVGVGRTADGEDAVQGEDWTLLVDQVAAGGLFPGGTPGWWTSPTVRAVPVADAYRSAADGMAFAALPRNLDFAGAGPRGGTVRLLGEDVATQDLSAPLGPSPGPREGYVAMTSGQRQQVWIGGGVNEAGETLTDLWRLDLETGGWDELDLPPRALGERFLAVTYSWHRRQLLLLVI